MNNVMQFKPIPKEAVLLEVMRQANSQHLKLVSNGKTSAICSFVPVGWHEVLVNTNKIKAA